MKPLGPIHDHEAERVLVKSSIWQVGAGLLKLTAGQRRWMPVLIGLSVAAYLFEALAISLLLPLIQALLARGDIAVGAPTQVNGLLSGWGEAGPTTLIAFIVLCVFLKSATAYASQVAFAAVNARTGDELRQALFRKILHARSDFHDRQRPGALLNTLATESWRLSEALQLLAGLVTHTSALVVFLVTMALLSWKLMLITAAATAVIFLLVGAVTARAKRHGDEAVAANRGLAARMTEGLAGLRTIRLFGQEEAEADRFARASQDVRRAFFRMDALSAAPMPMLELLFAVLLGGLLLGADVGEFVILVVFLALLQRLQPHAAAVMHARVNLLALAAPLQDVSGVLAEATADRLPDGANEAPVPAETIQFKEVTYCYPGAREPALSRVSFDIPAGRTTALIGMSGAGKSTVLSLVCRLIDPTGGGVFVDGEDLRSFRAASWRARMAVVPQDVYLFNATVRENIAYGGPNISDEAIVAAAQAAQAHDFVAALPHGYETRVGDRGVRFSGGQRQRIALARALVRDPGVLIQDEATNALDSLSERLVRDAIRNLGGGRTILIVAHRLASIEHADHIVVLDKGHVVEAGSPAELLGADGAYARYLRSERVTV